MEALIPGIVLATSLFYPKSNNKLFERSRVACLGMSSFSLAIIGWKKAEVSLLIVAPLISISIGLAVYGTWQLYKEIYNVYRGERREEHEE
jgi:hypothetical protein